MDSAICTTRKPGRLSKGSNTPEIKALAPQAAAPSRVPPIIAVNLRIRESTLPRDQACSVFAHLAYLLHPRLRFCQTQPLPLAQQRDGRQLLAHGQ